MLIKETGKYLPSVKGESLWLFKERQKKSFAVDAKVSGTNESHIHETVNKEKEIYASPTYNAASCKF